MTAPDGIDLHSLKQQKNVVNFGRFVMRSHLFPRFVI